MAFVLILVCLIVAAMVYYIYNLKIYEDDTVSILTDWCDCIPSVHHNCPNCHNVEDKSKDQGQKSQTKPENQRDEPQKSGTIFKQEKTNTLNDYIIANHSMEITARESKLKTFPVLPSTTNEKVESRHPEPVYAKISGIHCNEESAGTSLKKVEVSSSAPSISAYDARQNLKTEPVVMKVLKARSVESIQTSTKKVEASSSETSLSEYAKAISAIELAAVLKGERFDTLEEAVLVTISKQEYKPIPFVPLAPPIVRRKSLPTKQIELKSIPYSSIVKGKLPIWAYEPISILQLLCEELRFAGLLLKHAVEAKTSSQRMAFVAAFALSSFSALKTRKQKPFTPLCGETFEYISDDGWQYHAEQISQAPAISAAFAQHKDWEWHNCVEGQARVTLTGSAELTYKLPVILLLHKYKEIYTWNKVKALILNPLKDASKRVIRLTGQMTIRCSNGLECRLELKNSVNNEIFGAVYEKNKMLIQLTGNWDKKLSREVKSTFYRVLNTGELENLFEVPPPSSHDIRDVYYGFNPFTITLNELHTSEVNNLPPTDSRFRPDQRYLENGKPDLADQAKIKIETAQHKRCAQKQNKYKPLWFEPMYMMTKMESDRPHKIFRTNGHYWTSRAKKFKDEHSASILKDLFQGS